MLIVSLTNGNPRAHSILYLQFSPISHTGKKLTFVPWKGAKLTHNDRVCEFPWERPSRLGCSAPGGHQAEHLTECVTEWQPVRMLSKDYQEGDRCGKFTVAGPGRTQCPQVLAHTGWAQCTRVFAHTGWAQCTWVFTHTRWAQCTQVFTFTDSHSKS